MKTFRDHGIRVQEPGAVEQRTTCPQCSHKRKKTQDQCLAVNIEKGTWNCWHCGWSGGLEAKKERRIEFRPLPPDQRPKPTPDPLREKLVKYFEERGIPASVLDRNGVTMETRFVPAVGKDQSCIAFAYYVQGEVVNAKYRDAEKNFSQSKGGARVFYKLDDIADHTEVIICEGEVDALSWEAAGYINAVSVPDGAPNAEAVNVATKMKFLDNCLEYLGGVERFVIATDNDPNGKRLSEELARRLGKEKCWLVKYPTGRKDTNEVLVRDGVKGVQSLLDNAQPYPMEGSYRIDDVLPKVFDLYEHGYPLLDGCGDMAIDDLLRFAPGAVTVVTGIPNHGKSTWLDNILMRQAAKNGWRTSYFTPEHDMEAHIHRLAEVLVGKPFLPGESGRMNQSELMAAIHFLNDHVSYIFPSSPTYPIEAVLSVAAYQVRAYGINSLVLDPWNRLEHQMERGENENQYVARALSRIQFFAKNLRVHIFLVAHPKKMGKSIGGEGATISEVPNLYSISGSAHFYNMVDNGVTVYREIDAESGDTLGNSVYVQKVKHKHYGKLGRAFYNYYGSCQRFNPVSDKSFESWIDLGGVEPTAPQPAIDRIPNVEGKSYQEFAAVMEKQFGENAYYGQEGDNDPF